MHLRNADAALCHGSTQTPSKAFDRMFRTVKPLKDPKMNPKTTRTARGENRRPRGMRLKSMAHMSAMNRTASENVTEAFTTSEVITHRFGSLVVNSGANTGDRKSVV